MESIDRRTEIIAMAAGPDQEPSHIPYTQDEHAVWELITHTLRPMWEQLADPAILEASEKLDLPRGHIPQLSEVTRALKGLSGFAFRAVGGLALREEFFGGLAHRRFLSTQFIRDGSTPFYTKEPDIVHEVLGHATLLADPGLAELHSLAGSALMRVETDRAKQFVADVWWFSGEFGVVRAKHGVHAIGAGILSSRSELEHINTAKIVPIDAKMMGITPYRIDQLQPVLFAAESVEHLLNEIGSFFDSVSDGDIEMLENQADI